MIETKIIKCSAADFSIGFIIHSRDLLLLVDTCKMELLHLTTDEKVNAPQGLSDHVQLKKIDMVFIDPAPVPIDPGNPINMMIADSIEGKRFLFQLSTDENQAVSLSDVHDMPAGSLPVAAARVGEEYLLLDKGNSMILVLDSHMEQLKTIGSRMGYINVYSDEEAQRLGFEFPEDMAVSSDGQRIVVSDSGNKRLVVLSRDRRQEYVQQKVLRLPEYPFKILNWNETEDVLAVSDFDHGIMYVSLQYGFLDQEDVEPVPDFFTVCAPCSRNGTVYVVNEAGEPMQLTIPPIGPEAIARRAQNRDVLLKILIDGRRFDDARQLLKEHPYLLPVYAFHAPVGDKQLDAPVAAYVNTVLAEAEESNNALKEEIRQLSMRFVTSYKSIPDADDVEAANIDKEDVRHRMFFKLKHYRENLNRIARLESLVRLYDDARLLFQQSLDSRKKEIEQGIRLQTDIINANIERFDEAAMLGAIVDYWLLTEEADVLFGRSGLVYKKLFGNLFLLALLNDFYANIANLFFERNKTEQYITFIDREITMYSDKSGIFSSFIFNLIRLKKFEDVFRMLDKFPDSNKENLNYFRYCVYNSRGESDAAFNYLKKELDLYPHKVGLIPDLINLGKLNEAEATQYINKILEKSQQAIDSNYSAARAFKNIGNHEQAEYYVDRELELFPENRNAFVFKRDLYFLHAPGSMPMEYYRRNRDIFKKMIHYNSDEKTEHQLLNFFQVLARVESDQKEIEELIRLKAAVPSRKFRDQLDRYISFWVHIAPGLRGHSLDPVLIDSIDIYEVETYLEGFSTRESAYAYYFAQVREMVETDTEAMFQLLETLLTYSPGDPALFQFLDQLEASVLTEA